MSKVDAELLDASVTALAEARDVRGPEWQDGEESEEEEMANLEAPVMYPGGFILQRSAGSDSVLRPHGWHRTVSLGIPLEPISDS